MADIENPLEPTSSLKRPLEQDNIPPTQPILLQDSAVTKAVKLERNGFHDTSEKYFKVSESGQRERKRAKLDNDSAEADSHKLNVRDKVKGIALIKEEYVKKYSYTNGSFQFKFIKVLNFSEPV